ncbi:hypothetical protein ACTU6U_09460 [Microbacterium sp. A196]|uniref:hypothetical protein n=1 Tax=unclassified Microbacterium TaxID=2609290 RepID=UPI003FD0A1BF
MSAALLSIIVGASVAVLLGAALVISLATLRKPATMPMAVASILAGVALVAIVVVRPSGIPIYIGALIAVLGIAAATIGGNPFTRRALDIATGKRVRETEDGGILIIAAQASDPESARTLMRGGTVIGYLERVAMVISVAVGFPEAIAAIIAVKGIGRFPELAEPEARERFIIGTVASLLWAGVIGAVIRLALT